MKIIHFNSESGREITEFGSHGVIGSHFARVGGTSLVMMRFSPGGSLADHPAVGAQLFIVIQGEGWVRGENSGHQPILAGQAALWEAGEVHASGSEAGMIAIVIEAENLETH